MYIWSIFQEILEETIPDISSDKAKIIKITAMKNDMK